MTLLMGIDLGTSSLKVIVIDERGNPKALNETGYRFTSPSNGFAEQDVQVWWEACRQGIGRTLEQLGSLANRVEAIGFSGQMHGAVFLDQAREQIRPAILHCDARSAKQTKLIEKTLGIDLIAELLMNPIYTGFLLPSLIWVRDNEPAKFEQIRHVMLPKDYIKMRLTGEIISDFSDASATLAFDIKNMCWAEQVLQKLDISPDILPHCSETMVPIGRVTERAAQETGLKAGTLVVNGGGDQIMQAIGNGAVEPGMATVNIGSSGQVCYQCDRPIENSKLNTNTFCSFQPGRWITMGATMSAGLSLKWFNSLFGHVNYAKLNREVKQIRPGSQGLLFLPYLLGERTPHFNPNISGVFVGLTTETTRSQMARSVMEGVAYSLKECLDVCTGLGLTATELIASGGGAQSEPWLQLQADIYNLPLKVSAFEQQAGLGAAIVAGVGLGMYASVAEGCQQVVRYKEKIYSPDADNHGVYREYYHLFKETFHAMESVLERVTQLGRGISLGNA
ncbi:MAG TPA: xylulokinase [Firmicutes bacterium]|nr:xylulokinase [Bacillota bacterium]